jgi:hypothetical protein
MGKIIYLENIQAEAAMDHILMRMGYKKGITKMSPQDKARIGDEIKKARMLCRLQGAYLKLKIADNKSGSLELENGAVFKSSKLCALLEKSGETVLMASTAGKEPVEARDREVTAGNGSAALIIDAVASETADAGLDWIQAFLNSQMAKQGRKLTTRYSPGYGDLDLSAQKVIYDALKLEKIGISITDRYLLIPEKSVLAIAGII